MDFNQWEIGIIHDLERHYIGSAKVDLSSSFIDIEHNSSHGNTDPEFLKEVERLYTSFKAVSACPRRDPQQHMRVLIDRELLRDKTLGGILQAETDKLCFPMEQKLECLNRVEIIAAAKRYLKEIRDPDQWWYVDFYDIGLSDQARLYLREGFLSPQEESDGEEYLRWRSYKVRNDKLGAQRVISRLSKFKGAALNQLQNEKNEEVAKRFDKLRKYRGLWRGKRAFVLGRLRHILSWKCPNEICSYLDQVFDIWENIAGEDPEAVDSCTVNFLQSRCLKFSSADREETTQAFHEKKIFTLVTDDAKRNRIMENTLRFEGVILTLATFFKDSGYLKAIAYLCKPILPKFERKDSSSIRMSLNCFFGQGDDEQYVEVCEGRGESIRLPSDRRFSCAYLQLCFHAIRSYSEKQAVAILEEACLIRFVELARRIGFDTPKMRKVEAENRDERRLLTVQEEEYAIAIARQNRKLDNRVALLQRRQVISDPQFGTEMEKRERCNPNYIFLRTFQRGAQGPSGPYASSYCLLYYTVMAFWRGDFATLASVNDDLHENITQQYDDYLRLFDDPADDNGNNSNGNAFADDNYGLSFQPGVVSPSLYPQSAIHPSPPQTSHWAELLRGLIAASAGPNEVTFIKLETLATRVVPRTWSAIAAAVASFENGSDPFMGQHQVYGVVQGDRFVSFGIRALQDDFSLIEASDFTHLIFLVDRDSQMLRVVTSGRSFRECCEELPVRLGQG